MSQSQVGVTTQSIRDPTKLLNHKRFEEDAPFITSKACQNRISSPALTRSVILKAILNNWDSVLTRRWRNLFVLAEEANIHAL